jgi:hypothetical protein
VSVIFDPPDEPWLDPRTGLLVQQTLPPEVPLLALYKAEIDAKWTGPGNQVRDRSGRWRVLHLQVTQSFPSPMCFTARTARTKPRQFEVCGSHGSG